MDEITDFDALRRAMAENSGQPEGPARNARAEQLLAAAERLDIPLAVIEALGHELKVYNYSSEKDKMFVPFARLLRMWDERPEDFDEYDDRLALTALPAMQALLGRGDQVMGIEMTVNNLDDSDRIAIALERSLGGEPYDTRDWYDLNKRLFTALYGDKRP